MIERIRTILTVMEEGSINRAATRLGVSQPTLTRQIQAFEAEVGAPLFERGARGVRPTDLAFRLREEMAPVVKTFDLAWAEVSAYATGRHTQLRVGYIGLAANRYLTPVLNEFQKAYPEVKLWLFDQTPGGQLKALREGELDLALIGQEGADMGESEFFRQRIAKVGVLAALPISHRLARTKAVRLSELEGEGFVVPSEDAVPGRKTWVAGLCQKAGFRPRWLAETGAVEETFTTVFGQGGVSLFPDYMERAAPPGISLVPVSDRFAVWEFALLRQRGRMSPPCRDFIRWLIEAANS